MTTTARVGIEIVGVDRTDAAFSSAMARIKKMGTVSTDVLNRQRNMMFQMNDVFTQLASGTSPMTVLAQQGPQIAQNYGFGNGGVAAAFRDVGNMLKTVVVRAGPLAAVAGVGAAAFAALTYSINETTGQAYTMGEVFQATWDLIRNGVTGEVKNAVSAMPSWVKGALDAVLGQFKDMGNGIIRANVAWYEVVKGTVMLLPDLFLMVGGNAANNFIGAIQWMINSSNGLINGFIDQLNNAFAMLPEAMRPGTIGHVGTVELPKFDTSGVARNITDGISGVFDSLSQVWVTDYLGGFSAQVAAQAAANRAAAAAAEKGKKSGVTNRGSSVGKAVSPYNEFNHPLYGGMNDMRGMLADVEDEMSVLRSMGEGLKSVFQGWFDKAISGGLKFKDVLGGLQSVATSLASRMFGNVLDSLFAPSHPLYGGGSGMSGLFGSIFGGFRAGGGTVQAGKAYVVGERRPELFVPNTSGSIVPRVPMGGGNTTVQVIDMRSNAPAVERQQDSNGNVKLFIRDQVNAVLGGGGADGSMGGRFGMKPARIRR